MNFMYRQFTLQHKNSKITCWLEYNPDFKVGTVIAMLPSMLPWKIVEIGNIEVTTPPTTQWKVGGLY